MIVLAATLWSYLALHGIFVPLGAELIGPMKPQACRELRVARHHARLAAGECITIRWPQEKGGAR